MLTIRKILCPIDFSDACRSALAMACEWAERLGAELHLLHVAEGLSNPYPYLGPPFNEAMAWESSIRQKAREALEAWPLPEGHSARKVIRELRSGSPIVQIAEYAHEIKCELIVMGTHGRRGLSHLLLGSVAENVVRRAPCSVLTVRPSETPDASA